MDGVVASLHTLMASTERSRLADFLIATDRC